MRDVDAEALIADLDADQRAAVTCPSHLVAVVAGAGSGKTRVLTRRIAYRIATEDADPRHTLALTFTREAAGELRRRLIRLGLRDRVEAGTFHSVMLSVLKQRWTDTERRAKTIVPDRRRLLRDAQKDVGFEASRSVMEAANEEIGWAMARGIRADAYAGAARRVGRRPAGGVDQMTAIYEAYRTAKRRRGVIDFDDVLLDVLDDATRDGEFGDMLRWRFRHILVDEAQDLNPVQHQLIDLLRNGRDDLFLVGDPAQAVYGFNGADPALLVDVETRFPGVEVIRLPVNHRCTPQIVSTGAHVLDAGGQPTEIHSARDDGPMVALASSVDEAAEAAAVAARIAQGDPTLVRGGNVAVLARTNAQLTAFDQALATLGVAVQRSANASGSPIQQAMREATSLSSPSALRAWAHDTLDDIDGLSIATSRVEDLERRTALARRPASGSPSLRLVAPHTSQLHEAHAVLAVVTAERRVATALLEFLRDQPRGDGAEFRGWVATTNPFDDRSTDGVELLTFHASKGREWHTVFVTGVETSLMPHKSASTVSLKAEEARLLYVAATRATDVLYLSWAERRGGYVRKISPFVETLDLSAPEPTAPPSIGRRRAPVDPSLVSLREWRAEAARRANIIPTQLLTDRDLATIASTKPATAEELDAATSLGMMTAQRLAEQILPLVADGGSD